jgi:hypothetical protein
MNEGNIRGTILEFRPIETGTGQRGAWKKREILVECTGNPPRMVGLTVWGDRVDSISANYKVGDAINVECKIESRIYNNKLYTEVKPFKVVEG